MKEMRIITTEEPIVPSEATLNDLDKLQVEVMKDEYRQDRKSTKAIIHRTKNNFTKLYKTLWGQCKPTMRNKIRAHEDYTTAHESKSVIKLLKILEELCEHGDTIKNKRVQQFFAMKRVCNL